MVTRNTWQQNVQRLHYQHMSLLETKLLSFVIMKGRLPWFTYKDNATLTE